VYLKRGKIKNAFPLRHFYGMHAIYDIVPDSNKEGLYGEKNDKKYCEMWSNTRFYEEPCFVINSPLRLQSIKLQIWKSSGNKSLFVEYNIANMNSRNNQRKINQVFLWILKAFIPGRKLHCLMQSSAQPTSRWFKSVYVSVRSLKLGSVRGSFVLWGFL